MVFRAQTRQRDYTHYRGNTPQCEWTKCTLHTDHKIVVVCDRRRFCPGGWDRLCGTDATHSFFFLCESAPYFPA